MFVPFLVLVEWCRSLWWVVEVANRFRSSGATVISTFLLSFLVGTAIMVRKDYCGILFAYAVKLFYRSIFMYKYIYPGCGSLL